jgi:hypothetical protein
MKYFLLVALFWFGICIGSHAYGPVYQVRIYELHPGNEARFHDRFPDQGTLIRFAVVCWLKQKARILLRGRGENRQFVNVFRFVLYDNYGV